MSITRRNLLKGVGLGALSVGLLKTPSNISFAQSPTGESVAAFFRFALGTAEMIVVSDNAFAFPPANFGVNAPAEDLLARVDELNIPLNAEGSINVQVMTLILTEGDRVTIFDTGTGVGAGGKLVPTLDALGIGTEGVTEVVISHYHFDHIGGLSAAGAPTFPNAQVFFPQPEYDFLTNAPADVAGDALASLQPVIDNDQVTFYAAGDEVTSGIEAIATYGHTPGHMAFAITSGDSQMIHVVDSIANPYTSMFNPEWAFGFDGDAPLAVESRKAILDRISSDRLFMMGYHFPFPGLGYAVRRGEQESYDFVPAAF